MLGALLPHPLGTTMRLRLVRGVILGAAVLLVLPGLARAGTYKMYTCNVPGRPGPVPVPSIGPWTTEYVINTTSFDNCARGGTFGIGLNPGNRIMRPLSTAQLVLRRPATGPLSRIGIVRYKTWLIAQLAGTGAPAFISNGGAFGPPGGANTDSAPWVSPLFGQNNPSIIVQLYCSAGAPSNCFFNSATPLQARGIEVDLYEEAPPNGSIAGGSLLGHGLRGGTKSLSYSATDEESGVLRVEALLDDVVVARDDLGADPESCPRTGFNACRGRRTGDFRINTRMVPNGRHALSLRVTDAAGNRRLVLGPSVDIANGAGAEGSPNGTNASDAVQLSAYFTRSRRAKLTTRFGRRVVVRGRLRTSYKRPIVHAAIDVSERVALRDAVERQKGSTHTDAKGRFRYVVPRATTSRALTLTYSSRHGELRAAGRKKLTLKVRAASSLRLSLRGVSVRYSGRVLSRPLPDQGKLVLMQGRAKGGAWQTFATRRTARRGRFSGRYRLRVRRPGVHLQFRVMIPREPDYPFFRGRGRAVTRTVH